MKTSAVADSGSVDGHVAAPTTTYRTRRSTALAAANNASQETLTGNIGKGDSFLL